MLPVTIPAAFNLTQLLQHSQLSSPRDARLYDRDARPVMNIHAGDWAALLSEQAATTPEPAISLVLIQAEVRHPGRKLLQAATMMDGRSLLATGRGEVILVQQKSNRNLQLSCVLPYPPARRGLYGLDFSSDDTIRQLLKTSYAGWHHAYHELFAMASGFTLCKLRKASPAIA